MYVSCELMTARFLMRAEHRERLARLSGTMAQLGHLGWPLRVRIRHVRTLFPPCDANVTRGAHPRATLRQGYPDIRTVDYWLGGNKAERFPQSRCVRHVAIT